MIRSMLIVGAIVLIVIITPPIESAPQSTSITGVDLEESMPTYSNSSEWTTSDLEAVLSGINNMADIQMQTLTRQAQLKVQLILELEREYIRSHVFQQEQKKIEIIQKKVSNDLKKMLKSEARLLNKNEVPEVARDCSDIFMNGDETDDIYQVTTAWNSQSFRVFCDMETEGGGWTVLHRFGKESFNFGYFERTWNEYRDGFGDLLTDFWIGNKYIASLTRQRLYEVRFELKNRMSSTIEVYRSFWIENEARGFRLRIGNYDYSRSNSTDLQFLKFNEQEFSTMDRSTVDCAQKLADKRGWWITSECFSPGNEVTAVLIRVNSWNNERRFENRYNNADIEFLEIKIRPNNFLKISGIQDV